MEKLENSFPGKINNHVYYKAVIDFECPSCKRNTSYEDDEFTEFESDVNDFKNSVIHCEHCNTEYEIVDGKRNEVNLKLYE
jgi:Zn finger protein HypA/HybF involved in hydrogenase expression